MYGKHTVLRHNVRNRLFGVGRRRWVALTVLGLVAWRIHTTPSTIFPEDFPALNQPTTSASSQTNDPGAVYGSVLPSDWRSFLASHNNNTVGIEILVPTSQHTNWGCGISIRLVMENTQSSANPIPSSTKAFFKASHADMSHYDAESHLREVKAYYLDRILQTQVVLPCVGHRLGVWQVSKRDDWKEIEEKLECVDSDNRKSEGNGSKKKTTVDGSMMLWRNGLESIPRESILEKSRASNFSDYRPERESAMNYAIFHYLGACMKSEHNHFFLRQKKKNGNDRLAFVAIDNDRCMTPKAIFSNREVVPDLHFSRIQMWKDLVYERICHVPHHLYPVIGVILEASNSNQKISSRLLRDLQADALSAELVESEPEAFAEIDERVEMLVDYIRQNCPQK